MAITKHILTLLEKVVRENKFRSSTSIMELGAQFVLSDYAQVCSFFDRLNIRYDRFQLRNQMNGPKTSSRIIYERLGFGRFEAVDLDQTLKPLKFDLNNELRSAYQYTQTFDVVTNMGMSEHIMNQDMFFRNMHRLCKAGGLMLHVVPMFDNHEHGFFHYTPLFFQTMVKMNDYSLEGMWVSFAKDASSDCVLDYTPSVLSDVFQRLANDPEQTVFLMALLRKTQDIDFVTPYDEVIFLTVRQIDRLIADQQGKGA